MKKITVYEAMKHYRRKLLIIEAVLIAVFVCYFASSFAYVSNIFVGAVPFDEEKFSLSAKDTTVGEPFDLHRRDATNIPDFALKDSSHWQGKNYEFIVPLKAAKNTGIAYVNATTGTGSDKNQDDISAVLYVAKIGNKDTLVLAYPHQDLTKQSYVNGIFTSIPLIVKHDVAKSKGFSAEDVICEYMLDTRGLEMESETFDLTFLIVLFLIILYLGIKLIMYYKNHCLTPTYSQLEKYGEPDEVAKMVDDELRGIQWMKDECATGHWIISKKPFMLKIIRNYRQHGKFKYVDKK